MSLVARLLDAIPYGILAPIAIVLALAPFHPMPHLVEKVGMLVKGTLKRPVDVFDLFLHATPLVLLMLKFLLGRKG